MSFFDEGMQAFTKREYNSAIALFLQATKEDEKNHKAWNALGVTLVKTHQYKDADTCFKIAIDLAPGNGIYIKNQLSNRSKIPLKRSYTQMIRLEIDHLIRTIRTKKSGPLIVATLIICILCIILAEALPFIVQGIQLYISQIFGLGGVGAGLAFILLLYGGQILKSLSTISGIALALGIIAGVSIIIYVIINPSVLPLGNSHSDPEHPPISQVNFSRESPIQYSTEQPAGSSQTPEPIPLPLAGECRPPNPALIYTIKEYDPFTVTFQDKSTSSTQIQSRTWDFGDGTTSTEPVPTHVYPGAPDRYIVNYTVQNGCGTKDSNFVLDPQCYPINADFMGAEVPEHNQKITQFSDNSSPITEIVSWRWIFGDGESYYTTDSTKRNCTHQYHGNGIYYASLTVENHCKQEFTATRPITVEKQTTVSGIIWEDQNADGVRDPTEPGLANREVNLDENLQENWINRQTVRTNQTGVYLFTITSAGGSYRVRESAPDLSWRITNPSNLNLINTSPLFSLNTVSTTPSMNFGNKQLKSDKIHDISLQTSRNGTIIGGGYQSWIASGTGSMDTGTKRYQLPDSNRCIITISSNVSEGTILINGNNQEYSGVNASALIGSSVIPSTGNISVMVPTYTNYISDLHLKLNAEKSSYVNLIVDGSVIPVNWRQNVDIYNLMPTTGPRMIVTMSENETIFIGQASGYQIT
ncbi:MAG: PKD domain-containing protein [Methanospirillum sp.]|uniref:PKD domain-containing protein n=1 Tax=Methanospirillum sp. TaxID=45200 RepID=UPI0023737540|nr:PKD domain-containing protein [Methanospirillum sp.]MDD1729418.1 PKD domain-containing protein [Methanospirillum sp.]